MEDVHDYFAPNIYTSPIPVPALLLRILPSPTLRLVSLVALLLALFLVRRLASIVRPHTKTDVQRSDDSSEKTSQPPNESSRTRAVTEVPLAAQVDDSPIQGKEKIMFKRSVSESLDNPPVISAVIAPTVWGTHVLHGEERESFNEMTRQMRLNGWLPPTEINYEDASVTSPCKSIQDSPTAKSPTRRRSMSSKLRLRRASRATTLDEIKENEDIPDQIPADHGSLREVFEQCKQAGGESTEAIVTRFLSARKFQVQKSMAMLEEDLEWRRTNRVCELASKPAKEILNCDVDLLWDILPSWTQGYDRMGRPVIYKEWGRFKIWEAKKFTTVENLVWYHMWQNEQAIHILGNQTAALGVPITKFTCVFNAKDWHPGLCTRDAMAFLKGIAMVDQDHYPERLGTVVIINSPRLLAMVWNVVRTWLDPVTREKIHILASERDWRPVLERLIDPDQLPDIFGGNAPVQRPTGLPIPIAKPKAV